MTLTKEQIELLSTLKLRCGYIINGYGNAKQEATEMERLIVSALRSLQEDKESGAGRVSLVKMLRDQRDECADALRELVRLKDMHDEADHLQNGMQFPDQTGRANKLISEYQERKPAAWKAARAAIHKVPTRTQQLINVLDALQESPPPPAHRWVPVEPTEEMIKAGAFWYEQCLHSAAGFAHHAGVIWQAMISAAPSSGKEGQ